MAAKIEFFPVGNGDMVLITTELGRTILIDCNIRSSLIENGEALDVNEELRNRLRRDINGRLYVDVFLLSHPDKDHCTGITDYFHLGSAEDWDSEADKILIGEIWSSPIVFRRASKNHTLCDCAKYFNTEAKRRVELYRKNSIIAESGNKIRILGEDEYGKTDDILNITTKTGEAIPTINGYNDRSISPILLAPLSADTDEEMELLSKNHSSCIIQFLFKLSANDTVYKFLCGGDAEVAIWDKLYNKYEYDQLQYDILLAPHHCSWHSLSYDSFSEKGKDAQICENARHSLSQAMPGAFIISSSNSIKDDGCDPPCIRAKQEYDEILKEISGKFYCTGKFKSEDDPAVLEFEIGKFGPELVTKNRTISVVMGGAIGGEPVGHGC